MSTSSVKQSSFDFVEYESQVAAPSLKGKRRPDADLSATVVNFPTFDYSSVESAAASRIAGRLNALSIKPEEHQAWLNERQLLLDKEFAGTITPRESNRLKYVCWSLDRVDDARYGHDLEMLETAVSRFEQLQADIQGLQKQLSEHLPGRKSR
jgi:hypothetical protein